MKTIKDIPEHSRPREKLRERGPQALTDEELVAAILGTGTSGIDVRTMARQVAVLIREHKEYLRLSRKPKWPRTFCTMLTCTDIVRLPGYRGRHKWPTLEEAYYHFFRRPLADAHDALADVRACSAIFQELSRRGLTP